MTQTSSSRRRYVLVGTGGRSFMFSRALLSTHSAYGELVGLCDTNQARMDYSNACFQKDHGLAEPLPTYRATEFDRMIAELRPDVVIVTTIDRTHHLYLIRAMELGCDAITEKPLTIDAEKCQQILDTVERTGRNLKVAFNYRYAPLRSKVKELLDSGAIGEVKSVHFEWLLDTNHGADYFRRWHRDKRNSGGLMVHKSTHHFDLVNWWLGSEPERVFAFGQLAFYGRDNAEARGVSDFYYRSTGEAAAKDCPFALDLTTSEHLRSLYLDPEKEDAYLRDRSVFSDGISIEDTMNVLVRYRNGAQMSYSLHAYSPWEGYRVAFNGTKGRIEVNHQEASYINAKDGSLNEGSSDSEHLILFPHFQRPEVIEVQKGVGGHGGGDTKLLDALFNPDIAPDPLHRAANHRDGALSILTGIAANQSMATGQPVDIAPLIRWH